MLVKIFNHEKENLCIPFDFFVINPWSLIKQETNVLTNLYVFVFIFIEYNIGKDHEKLGSLVIEALTTLLNGNTNNANVFRESGGAKCALALVPFADSRYQALGKAFYHNSGSYE